MKKLLIYTLLLCSPLWSGAYLLGASQALAAESQETERVTQQLVYYGSTKSEVYHRSTCKQYLDRIKDKNWVAYYSKAEAEKVGKRPCLKCMP